MQEPRDFHLCGVVCVRLYLFVQLLNVILLFMYMSLFFKQYFVNVWIYGKASLCCEAGRRHLSFITGALQHAGLYPNPAGQ